MDNSKTRI